MSETFPQVKGLPQAERRAMNRSAYNGAAVDRAPDRAGKLRRAVEWVMAEAKVAIRRGRHAEVDRTIQKVTALAETLNKEARR